MAEVTVTIGGRGFEVACQDGEEKYLHSAAAMLDREAGVLVEQIGRIPEGKMLLMAGLMLADRTAAGEDRVQRLQTELAALKVELADVRANPPRVEVPVVPPHLFEALAEMSAQAEALADNVEDAI
ncbi:cell division protein ZapA [Rhodobacteraceae bacterium]|nr:cell division protein ZapA [Paracoccaceae bacterium]